MCQGGPLGGQWNAGKSDEGTADPVLVTGGAATAANATLTAGGSIAGTVVGPDGKPYEGACVIASNNAAHTFQRQAQSSPTGYRIDGLAPGSYQVNFVDCRGGGLGDQWANGRGDKATADAIAVAAGATVTVNGALSASRSLLTCQH